MRPAVAHDAWRSQAGASFYRRSCAILAEVEELIGELSQALAEPRGTLRVTAPYGISIVMPVAAIFRQKYPDCQLDITLTDHILDLTTGELDLAIRLRRPSDSALKARRIGVFRQYFVGSPVQADVHN